MQPTSAGLLIIQTAFPGDVILAGGLVRSVRSTWPDLPLAMVVRPDCEPLARMMDPRLEVLVFDKRGAHAGWRGITAMATELRQGPWDAALIPQRYARSALLGLRAGLRPRVGFDLAPLSGLFYSASVPYRRGVHEVERNHDLLQALSLLWEMHAPDMRLPLLSITPRGVDEAESVFDLLGDRDAPPDFVCLGPGSVWATKRWPPRYWARLAAALSSGGLQVVLIGGEGDRQLCEEIAASADTGLVAAGALGWEGSAALLNRARLLVSGDSAPVHLAGAVRCPVVSIFGPTVPGFGFGPLGAGSRAVGLRLGCRPCTLHGGRECPEGHFRCMLDLGVDQVSEAVADTIEAAYGGSRGRETIEPVPLNVPGDP